MITYLAGQSGQCLLIGLAADSKPLNPPASWLFIETDTAKTYTGTGSAWEEVLNSSYVGGGQSGVLTGGVLSIGTGGAGVATTFTIASGTGVIANNAVDPTTVTSVSWTAKTDVAVTDILTQLVTFVAIDSNGDVIQSATDFTPEQMRQYIVIGVVVHSNQTTVNAVNQAHVVAYNAGGQLADLMYGIGIFNVSGNVFSANGANMTINKSAGSLFRRGANYSSLTENPHIVTTGALTQAPLRMQNVTGAGAASTTDVDVANYDVAGVTTAISPATRFSILRVFLFQSNLVAVQRGQATYLSLAEAKAAIQTESYTTNAILAANGLLRGFIVAQANATSLNDTSKVFFIDAGKFGGTAGVGGLSVSTLQDAYDNSSTPEVLTDATRGALTVKQGSGADTDAVIEVQNGAGTPVATVTGEGNITVSGTVDGRDIATDGTKLDGIESLADVTDATNVNAAGAVMESDYNAQTILAATADNTPAALTVGEQTLVGRITAGNIAALTAAQVRTLINVADGSTAGATWGSNITSQPAVVGQAEAEAGVATTERIWTAQRVAQAIAALGGGGGITSIAMQSFVTNGTYTPTSGMAYCIVILTGSGAGGGGADSSTTTNDLGVGGGGGAGATRIGLFTAADIGVSKAVVIPAGGAAGLAANGTTGSSPADATFGSTLLVAPGGDGGVGSGVATEALDATAGGAGGTSGSGGLFGVAGGDGSQGYGLTNDATVGDGSQGVGGCGGASFWGGGGQGGVVSSVTIGASATSAGGAGKAAGSGGGGGVCSDTAAGVAGGDGVAGLCWIIEFIS